MTDHELLNQYVMDANQGAFTELVGRHIGWVQASALRQMGGEPGTAQDVTQAVFILLASKARGLCDRPDLLSWLFGALRYCAKSARRSEQRRRIHEQKAAAMTAESNNARESSEPSLDELLPNLDEMIARLGTSDRQAILLRFFQKKTLAEIGVSMGISEEAAKKRVARAVGRMRNFFVRDGLVLSTEALIGAMGARTVSLPASPAHAADVANFALRGGQGSNASAIANSAAKMMIAPLFKVAAMCAIAALIAGASVAAIALHRSAAAPAIAQSAPATLSTSQTPAPVETVPDQTTPGNLIRRIDYASAHADRRMLLDCVITRNEPERQFMDAMAEVIMSMAELHGAAIKQFGQEGRAIAALESAAPMLLNDSRWKVEGDRATGFDMHMGPGQTVAVREAGIWKIDLGASHVVRPQERAAHTASFRKLAQMNRELTVRILCGQISSASEAAQQLQQNHDQSRPRAEGATD
ncbi:MAG TPA: sigma-70 family RNA polymerase sigma factor [Tepidisphaeraceae bacterium]|nr:sigma-70 family RNA polymerase sigma factor [Tepidisphaeraceae bacterium]